MTERKRFNLFRAREERRICRFFKGVRPGALYDVGVGIYSEAWTLRYEYPGLPVYGCEPNPAEYERLKSIFPGKLLPIALDENSGRRVLQTSPAGEGQSSFHEDLYRGEAVEVETWTLDRFDEWAGKPNRIVLWMDVEGWELPVLRGGPELLRSGRVRWMNLESRDVAPFPGHPTTADLDSFLADYGYRRVKRYNLCGRHEGAAGDSIYVLRR